MFDVQDLAQSAREVCGLRQARVVKASKEDILNHVLKLRKPVVIPFE